jgi:hypothetical protein
VNVVLVSLICRPLEIKDVDTIWDKCAEFQQLLSIQKPLTISTKDYLQLVEKKLNVATVKLDGTSFVLKDNRE